jgi:hypothetical protein
MNPFQSEALCPRGRTERRDAASSAAPVASGYERDAASLPRTPHHGPGDESSF